jgi:sporulation protein YlmC with PRC-barrel domain
MYMYRESELLGKEVISSEGRIIGKVIEVTVKDDVPGIVVADKKFLVSKDRLLKSENTVTIPYYEIDVVHDKILLSKTVEELSEGI